jgi:hypothetical protein
MPVNARLRSPNQAQQYIKACLTSPFVLAVRFGGAPMPASLRLIRFATMTALVADIWTVFCAVSIVVWQMIIFLSEGSWHALPLSFVFNTLESSRGEIYSTASIDKIERSHSTNLADALLQVPVIVPLLLGAALLTAFYLWLSDIERRIRGN